MSAVPFRLVLLGLLLTGVAARAATIEQLTRTPTVAAIKISPDGRHLAARVFYAEQHNLVFLDRKTKQRVGATRLTGPSEVGKFYWANDERVVAEVYKVPEGEERPYYYGQLFATNIDGSGFEVLFGYTTGEVQTGTLIEQKDSDRAWARVVDALPDDSRHILISSTRWSRSHGRSSTVQRLDVYSGLQRRVDVPAKGSDNRFFTDRKGVVRVITGRSDELELSVQTKGPGADWIDVEPGLYGDNFTPLAMTDDGASVYALDNIRGDRIGLYRLSLDGGQFEKIYEHNSVDITDAIMSTDGRSVYALRGDDGYPSYLIFSKTHDEAQVFKGLLQSFEGMLVSIESRSRDGRFWIIRTSSDRDPGAFHLFDRKENTVALLYRTRPDVLPEELASMRPVSFTSFDGHEINGYFTAAERVGDRPAPLVVLLHGGLHMRDYWGYDPTVQVLATRGFSVLQINFRGSSGYGAAFRQASERQWGDAVQQDVIAGTRWAITEKLAEPGRICVMGASFGAYSAVQSAVLEPGLFACVVATAGLYDLPLLYRTGDISTWYAGEAYLEGEIGRDEEELRRFSPIYAIDRLEAPVFIAHGRRDERAPIEHARNLRKALDEHEKAYEWYVEPREAHGFYDNTNEVEYLQAVVAFLQKHLNATPADQVADAS